jgi:type II secretory pathway pseudopilin PulG
MRVRMFKPEARARGTAKSSRSGMTLVEVCVAMALTTLMTVGLYAVGLQARKFAEHNRLATEGRSLAKERLEEMISVGMANLAKPTCTLISAGTNESSLGYTLVRQPRIAWHAADGSVVAASNAVYAELHVDVSYNSPMTKAQVSDTYSTIVQ